ncbi:hypothetical protein QBC43DRAFT_93826 [Cladorrhinum sp. PSN259]|nr:hypothetical protein QBC43DRAFT_93826 [Cladorrhinum sp. PSN259]
MAEILGTAVGVASLGIRVCQGIATYLRSVKGRDKRISDALKEVQTLMATLDAFKSVLPDLTDRKDINVIFILDALKDCDNHILRLEQLLSKWTRSPPPKSFKRIGRAIIFPFREEQLTSLQKHIQGLLSNLDRILHIASVKHYLEAEKASSAINLKSSDEISCLQSIITNSMAQVNKHFDQTQLNIRHLDSNINGKLTLMHNDMRLVGSTSFLMYQQVTAVLKQITEKEEALGQLGQLLQVSSLNGNARKASPKKAYLHKPASCNCIARTHTDTYVYNLWGATVQYDQQETSRHRNHCKFYGLGRPTRRKRSLRAEFPLRLGWLLGRVNWVSIQYVMGINNVGFSIRLKNIVPIENCMVSQQLLMLNYQARRGPPEACERIIKSTEYSIIELYRSGKASPNDRDENGWSHAIKCMQILLDIICHVRINASMAGAIVQLFHSLSESIEDDDEVIYVMMIVGIYARTVLRGYTLPCLEAGSAKESDIKAIISSFVRGFSPSFVEVEKPPDKLTDMLDLEDIDDEPMLKAIAKHSLEDLEEVIMRNPESTTRRIRGHTMLQVAATWSEGLQRLLSTDAIQDLDVGQHDSPFLLTCRFKYPDALDILLKKGCRIPTKHRHSSNTTSSYDLTCLDTTSNECLTIFAKNLADRRRKLLSIAQETLGIYQSWDPTHIPDSIASNVCSLLNDSNIYIPEHLTVPAGYKTIYHNPSLSMRHFPIFYTQGFRGYNSHDFLGLTASMVWRGGESLGQISWDELTSLPDTISFLEQHGFLDSKPTDPLKLGLNVHATGWHYWASTLGHALNSISSANAEVAWDLINKISSVSFSSESKVHDNCICLCSNNSDKRRRRGCSPLLSFWKATCSRGTSTFPRQNGLFSPHTHALLHHHPLVLSRCSNAIITSDYALDLVRFLTFEALEMRHTCCSLRRVKIDRQQLYTSTEQQKSNNSSSDDACNDDPMVIVDCPEQQLLAQDLHEIRTDEPHNNAMKEKEEALLETLMSRFEKELQNFVGEETKSPLAPKALENFLRSNWLETVSGALLKLKVDKDLEGGLIGVYENVRTYELLPKRVEMFLGKGFLGVSPDDD